MPLVSPYPLNLYKGDSYSFEFRIWQDQAKTIPFNLNGVAVMAEIRKEPDINSPILASFSCSVTQPNIIIATLNATDTNVLPPCGAWDLRGFITSVSVVTFLFGPVFVQPFVTVA